VRFNSSLGVAATTVNPTSVNFGEQPVSTQGSATIVDGNMFTITGNTCSNTTVAIVSSCTISVRANATALGPQSARIRLPVNSAIGAIHVPLTLTGVDWRLLTVTPPSLNFGWVTRGQSSATMSTTLKATGIASVSLGSVALGGGDPEAVLVTEDTCTYCPLTPFRLFDTREGNGAPRAPIGPGRIR
jgi:hypothetical protein